MGQADLKGVWERICKGLGELVSADAVRRWFAPLRVVSFEGQALTLSGDNAIYQYWVEENYLPQLTAVATKVLGGPVRIHFLEAPGQSTDAAPRPQVKTILKGGTEEAPAAVATAGTSSRSSRPATSAAVSAAMLHPRNTFETFVVGPTNQFAHAAALAVGRSPARTYNPLFLHGSVGLGKTHLMQAVGHLILKNRRNAKVRYVTSEQFTNEYIQALQHNQVQEFRRRYRQIDVLLIDDIQFLAGKERSQEEFFHTFNSLYDVNKQIVMTCDSPPNEIANIEKRLCSRFEWGLTAELVPPDVETRMAILRKKMDIMPHPLDDAALEFIAVRVRSNVRRLEGALTRVSAYAALHGRALEATELESLLRDLVQQEAPRTVTMEVIQRRVAETYDIRLADMTSKRRPANIALPRMVAMYLSRKLTAASLAEIGDAFGGRDHGTVLHAHRAIEARMEQDARLRQTVEHLAQKLGTGSES